MDHTCKDVMYICVLPLFPRNTAQGAWEMHLNCGLPPFITGWHRSGLLGRPLESLHRIASSHLTPYFSVPTNCLLIHHSLNFGILNEVFQ